MINNAIVLRVRDWNCAVCGQPMCFSDFSSGAALAITGPEDHLVAHCVHFGPDGGDYKTNMRRLAERYIERNPSLKEPR